jgi:hypothetical protein
MWNTPSSQICGFFQGMIQSLLACLQRGGVRKLKMFPKTLTMIWEQIVEKAEQDSMRVAMPASTKIMTACETKTKSKGLSRDYLYSIQELMHI